MWIQFNARFVKVEPSATRHIIWQVLVTDIELESVDQASQRSRSVWLVSPKRVDDNSMLEPMGKSRRPSHGLDARFGVGLRGSAGYCRPFADRRRGAAGWPPLPAAR